MQLALPVRVSVLALLSLLGASCGKQPDAAPNAAEPKTAPLEAERRKPALTVRIGYQKIGSPFLLKARSESLDAALAKSNAKVEWVEFQAGPPLLEAMRGGAVDVGYAGETPPVFAQAGGVPFIYVASDPPAPKSEAILVPKNSKAQTIKDLKGKKIALNRGSNVHYLLLQTLERAQLTLKDVDVVYLAPPDARSAFDSGQVDAWVIWDPFQAAAEIAGARALNDGEGLVQNQFFYVARRAFADEHPELVRTVLDEFALLSEWAGAHPEEASRLLTQSSGVAYEALLLSERRHVYGVRALTPEVIAQQQKIADAFYAQKLIPKLVKIADAAPAAPIYGDAR